MTGAAARSSGAPRPAHLGGHPPRLDGVAQHIRPPPGHPEGQRHVEQLGVRVRLRPVPPPLGPLDVVEAGRPASVHARAEIDQPPRPIDQSGEHVGGQHVDREGELVAVLAGLPGRAAEADPGVVDDRVVAADAVGLFRHRAGLLERRQIPDDDGRAPARNGPAQVGRPLLVAGVERHLVALLQQQPAGHQPDAVTRPGYQNSRHPKRYRGSGQAPRLLTGGEGLPLRNPSTGSSAVQQGLDSPRSPERQRRPSPVGMDNDVIETRSDGQIVAGLLDRIPGA